MSTVPSAKAERPLVLALDLGTSSARAVLYDTLGRLVDGAESRIEYRMTATPDGGVEVEADRLVEILARVIDELLAHARTLIPDLADALCGVGGCTFWHSVLGIGPDGRAVTDETIARGSPAGTFFDYAVVHLVTTGTLARFAELYPQGRFDVRRWTQLDSQRKIVRRAFRQGAHFGGSRLAVDLRSRWLSSGTVR